MNENTRMLNWEQDIAVLKQAHDQAYQVAQAHARFFSGAVAKLKEEGIDLQPLFSQLQKDLENLNSRPK